MTAARRDDFEDVVLAALAAVEANRREADACLIVAFVAVLQPKTRAVKAPINFGGDLRHLKVLLFVFLPALVAIGVVVFERIWMLDPAAESGALLVHKVATAWCQKNGGGQAGLAALQAEHPELSAVDHAGYSQLVSRFGFRVEAGDFRSRGTVCKAAPKKTIKEVLRSEYLRAALTADLAFVALLILAIPGLFGLSAFLARRELLAARLPSKAGAKPSDFEHVVWCRRYDRWLDDESKWLFWRRWAFFVFLSFGVNYMSSPAGVQGTIIGEFGSLNPLPGTASHPFFIAYYANAPVYVAGFAGYYLYAVTMSIRRQLAGSLTSVMLTSLLVRGLVVTVISAILSGVAGEGPSVARALAFIAGIFPETGLQYIRNIAKIAAGQQAADPTAGFRGLPEVDADVEAALNEVGVASAQELALTDWEALVERVGIPPRSLLYTADRALLFLRIIPEKAKALAIAIPDATTASSIVLYALGSDAYADRWLADKGRLVPPLADKLTDAEKSDRLDKLAKALDAIDVRQLVHDFAESHNVAFVIDNLIKYGRS